MCENVLHKSYKKLFSLALYVINVSLVWWFNWIIEEIIESRSEFEQDSSKKLLSSYSNVEIKLKWYSNVEWAAPQNSLFEKQKTENEDRARQTFKRMHQSMVLLFIIFYRWDTESNHVLNNSVQ